MPLSSCCAPPTSPSISVVAAPRLAPPQELPPGPAEADRDDERERAVDEAEGEPLGQRDVVVAEVDRGLARRVVRDVAEEVGVVIERGEPF